MKPVLYYDIRSPPVRSCLMLMKYLNIELELKSIDLFKREHLTKDFLQITPLHTVPTLTDGDLVLTDSHSILIYLCQKYSVDGGIKLWPNDEKLRIQILNMLFFNNSILFRRDSDMFIEIFQKSQKNVDHHKKKILEAFDMLEKFLQNRKYIVCDYMTIADISIVAILSTVDIIFPITIDKWPQLHTWYELMKSQQFYKNGNIDGLNALKTAVIEYAKFDLPYKQHENK